VVSSPAMGLLFRTLQMRIVVDAIANLLQSHLDLIEPSDRLLPFFMRI
jgi:hypothetical protein